jgi:hypothetical protein
MAMATKKRLAASSIKIDANVRCQRIYPVEDKTHNTKKIAELKTVGIKLSREQAIHLARVLLAASQEWEEIDITAWRVYKRQWTTRTTSRLPALSRARCIQKPLEAWR